MSAIATPPPKPRLTSPPLQILPKERLTCAEFHSREERGDYGNRRVMLVRGEVRELEPMNPPHAVTCEIVEDLLKAIFQGNCYVRHDKPLCLKLDTDPRPDFCLLEGKPRDHFAAHPTASRFVMEVSDTTLASDLGEKKTLYALGGVPDYWVLDLNRRRLHVFRDPAGDAYATTLTLSESDTVSPLAKPDAIIKVADLLP